jgi:predicted nucleic acid-binding Zn ribbon protein
MPLYIYRCDNCGEREEHLLSRADATAEIEDTCECLPDGPRVVKRKLLAAPALRADGAYSYRGG